MRLVALSCALAMASSAALAQSTPSASAPAAQYSTSATDIGTLLDDPAAKAILSKRLPELVKSDQIDMARAMTLKQIQEYAPDVVTDKALADVDAELAKLPQKH